METNLLFNEPYSKLAHDNYPLLLGASKYCPKQLFCKGTLPTNDKIGIAMVGTRRPSASAEELCRRLVESLRSTNAVVISGLAQGIDSFCHRAALDAGIPTIAVLAQGLDAKIEGERNTLAKRILDAGGALLSEYEGDTPAYKGNFIARNRIISGLSQSTLVVQSRKKGGALLTAQFCLDEGKLLLACPGNTPSPSLRPKACVPWPESPSLKEQASNSSPHAVSIFPMEPKKYLNVLTDSAKHFLNFSKNLTLRHRNF